MAGSTPRVDGEVPRAMLRGAAAAFVGYSKPTTRGDTVLPYDTYELPALVSLRSWFRLFLVGLFYTIDGMNYGDKVPQTPPCNYTLVFLSFPSPSLFLSPIFWTKNCDEFLRHNYNDIQANNVYNHTEWVLDCWSGPLTRHT